MGFCPQCGTARVAGAAFCVKCGAKLTSGGSAPSLAPVFEPGLATPHVGAKSALAYEFAGDSPAAAGKRGGANQIGSYKVLSLIGKGGQGATYRAEQIALGRPVCIKVLHAHLAKDPRFGQRFALEGRATAAIRHPNVVSVFDVGTTPDGTAFIVMEMVEGQQLRQLQKAEGPFEWRRAVRLIDQMLAGLAEAHANNIVHRDLKPSNVLVSRLRDDAELVKVVDFGIATVAGERLPDDPTPGSGEVFGTPGYIAPEQLRGQKEDGRADLYAVGVILWELLCGKRMFSPAGGVELMARHLNDDAPAPSTVHAGIPSSLDVVVLKALSKQVNTRYADASAFRRALKATLDEQDRVQRLRGTTGTIEAPRDAGLVGREAELRKLESLLAHVSQQKPAGVVVTGRRGLGKTRLLHEFERTASAKGFVVGRVSCRAVGQERMSMMKALTANLTRGLRDKPPAESGGTDASRILKTLLRAAEVTPVLLLVDDADDADPASLEVMDELLARAADRKLGLVLTARARTADVLKRLPRLPLTPLDGNAIGSLLHQQLPSGRPSAGLVELLLKHSSGNPWLVSLLLSSLLESGHVSEVDSTWQVQSAAEAVTDAVQLTVAVELEKLEPESRQLLLIGALQGRRFMLDLAARVSEGFDVSKSLGPCVTNGWITKVDDARYEFEEPLTQLALRSMSSLAELRVVVASITDLLAFEVPANVEFLQCIVSALFAAATLAPRSERPEFFEQLKAFFDALASHGRYTHAIDAYEGLIAYARQDRSVLESGSEALTKLRDFLLSPAFVDPLVTALGDAVHGNDAEAALRRIAKPLVPTLLESAQNHPSNDVRSRLIRVLIELAPDTKTAQTLGRLVDAKMATEVARRVRTLEVSRSAPVFAQLLSSTDVQVRRVGAHLVPPAAIPMLGKNLIAARAADVDAQVRLAFLMRVTEAEEPSAWDAVRMLTLRPELDLAQRAAAYGALAAIDELRAYEALVLDIESNFTTEAKVLAVQTLTKLSDPRARLVLEDMSKKLLLHPKLRSTAKDALAVVLASIPRKPT